MRGIKRIGLLTLGFILFGVTSCDDYTPKYSYNLEDNDLSKKIYSEYENEFSNSNYNNFLINCTKKTEHDEVSYEYLTFTIVLNNDGSFKEKIVIKDKIKTIYKYINDSWIKTDEKTYIDGKEKITFNISFNLDDGSFKNKFENTYDDKGNRLTGTSYKYINNEWVKDLEYRYINGKNCTLYSLLLYSDNSYREKNEYTYDDNGNQLSSVSYYYINNEWVLHSKYEYTYDENGNELIAVIYDTLKSTKFEYTYDEKGYLLTEVEYTYSDNEWIFKTKEEFYYNSNGKKISEEKYNYIDNSWVGDSKFEYAYNSNGRKISESKYNYINNSWVSDSKFEYTYNSNGKTISVVKYNYNDNSKIEQIYNEEGLLITETKSSYSDNEWHPKYKEESIYDTNKCKTRETKYKYINGEWIKMEERVTINDSMLHLIYSVEFNSDDSFKEKKECTYNDKGKILTELEYLYVDNKWVLDNKDVYTYDSNGNELTKINYIYKDNEWKYYTKKENTYNSDGILITLAYYTYDNNDWVYDSKYEYTHEDRKLISIFYSYVNNEWKYINKVETIYDSNGDISSITYYKYKNGEWVFDIKF